MEPRSEEVVHEPSQPRDKRHALGRGLVMVVGALGLMVLTGFTGLISLGHVGFLMLGGYAYAIGVTRLGLPPELADGAPVAVICASGRRSVVAASLLQRFGRKDVLHVVEGGVETWAAKGYESE